MNWLPLPGKSARAQKRAKQLLAEASASENGGDLEKALPLYERGVALMQDAIKGEKNPEKKAELHAEAQAAIAAAERIEARIACQSMTLSCKPPSSIGEAATCLRASPRLAGITTLLLLQFCMWFVFLTDLIAPGGEYRMFFATAPPLGLRSLLVGVPLSWLCHSDYKHIAGNSTFMMIFGTVIVMRSAVGDPVRTLLGAVACSQLGAGLTWLGLFGSPGACGASGIVYGLFGYSIAFGLFRVVGAPPQPTCSAHDCTGARSVCECACGWLVDWLDRKNWLCTLGAVFDIVLSSVLFVTYNYIFEGATPAAGPGISWQGHLYGMLGGMVWAAVNAERARRNDREALGEDEEQPDV